MCRPRLVRTTEDEPVFSEVTMELLEWSITAMRCCSILLIHVTTKLEICLVTEKNEIQEIRTVFDWLTGGLPKGTSFTIISIDWSCKICILYGSRWRSWCIMRITELLRSISWDKRLVDFVGDWSKHCLTVIMWFSVLTDRGRPLRP